MMITQAKPMVSWQWLCYRQRNVVRGWAATSSWWSRSALQRRVLIGEGGDSRMVFFVAPFRTVAA
eukprot:3803583-Lingulodinium_polyedra.AAC.1